MKNKIRYGSKSFWDNFYSEESIEENIGASWKARQLYRYEQYLNILDGFEKRFENICDIGCSYGDFTKTINNFLKPKNILGLDQSHLAIERACEKNKASNLKFDFSSLPSLDKIKDKKFNFFLLLEVFYYLKKEDRILSLYNIHKGLSDGGFILVSVVLGKKPYFNKIDILRYINIFFEIKKINFVYNRFYNKFEKNLNT